jgi:hypothetical protein
MGLLKNKLRIGAPEEKRAVRLKPETIAVGHTDGLVQALKEATVLSRLNRAPDMRRREPCSVGCGCPPCRRGDCNFNVRCCTGSSGSRGSGFGMPYGRTWR